jgi:hypothetical protein|nr:hypothetical protein [Rahnella aquatilis]
MGSFWLMVLLGQMEDLVKTEGTADLEVQAKTAAGEVMVGMVLMVALVVMAVTVARAAMAQMVVMEEMEEMEMDPVTAEMVEMVATVATVAMEETVGTAEMDDPRHAVWI